MAFELPPAPRRYDQANENQARRLVSQAFADIFARLEQAELAIAEGGVTPAEGPTAGFGYSADFLVVSFTDASSEGDSAIVTRLWDFGDGTTSSLPNNTSPIHTYPDAGEYIVTLTVTDGDGLEDEYTETITVEEDSQTEPTGAPAFLVWGTKPDEMPARFLDIWNGVQAAEMIPGNCEEMLDFCADNGLKTFVRLWRHNFVKDANGNWQMSLFEDELERYNTPTLRAKIAQRSQDGTIIGHVLADDILSSRIWGTSAPLQGAVLDNMAAYSRQLFPDLYTIVRARVFQCGDFAYQHLQSVNAQYVFGRGGVSQGGMSLDAWRRADALAYAQQEEADLAALPGGVGANMEMIYGLNIVNGGDGTSGWPGDGSPAGAFAMGASELRAYTDVLAPRTFKMFSAWERGANGQQDAYLDDTAIRSALLYCRNVCDSLGD
jgi:PKD repeat protein